MGVADRARKQMPSSGDYLDKDDLIRAQDEPFGIKSVVYDEKGSNYGPRWVLSLIPWFEEQEAPKGLLTFTANPTRNPFMEDLQLQIDENDGEPIGPCVLIKDKSQKGYRYYTIDDWSETPTDVPTPAPARPARPSAPAPQQEVAAANPPEPEKPKRGRPRKSATPNPGTATPASSTSVNSTLNVTPASTSRRAKSAICPQR